MKENLSTIYLTIALACICAGSGYAAHLLKQQVTDTANTSLAPSSPTLSVVDSVTKTIHTAHEQLLSVVTPIEEKTTITPAVTAATPAVHEVDDLVISPSEQPQKTLAPAGAGGVPFTTFTLTAGKKDVTVRSITIQQQGAGAAAAFDSIALNRESGEQVGDEKGFHADSKATFTSSINIPAGKTKVFTIVGNMVDDLSLFGGQTPQLAVVAIDASSAVRGLPVTGTAQTINDTLIIGSATADLSPEDPHSDTNRYVNDTGIRFSGVRITANATEDLLLSSITWDQAGTAAEGDIANAISVLGGRLYPTEVDGRSYTTTFEPAVRIKKGDSVDVYVQGDLLVSGVNRTVKFDIAGSADIALTGGTYGYGVGIAAGGSTATDGNSVFITSTGDSDGDEGAPFFSGSLVTIHGGSVNSIEKANSN